MVANGKSAARNYNNVIFRIKFICMSQLKKYIVIQGILMFDGSVARGVRRLHLSPDNILPLP